MPRPAPRPVPTLELLIVTSTRPRDPLARHDRLALRLPGGDRQRAVMEALAPAGFLEGDRVTLELRPVDRMPGVEAINFDLRVIRSTVDASRLSLRTFDSPEDGDEVMRQLYPAGFRAGDRPTLRLLWRGPR